jgi:fucose permease
MPRSALRMPVPVILCFPTMFMVGITITILGPSLPSLAERTGASLSQAGILFTVFSIGSLGATLVTARLIDRPLRQIVLVSGALLMALGWWLLTRCTTLVQASGALLVAGIGASATGATPNAIVGEWFGKRSGPALNFLHVIAGAGSLVGPLIIAQGLGSGLGYASLLPFVSLVDIALALAWIGARPDQHRPAIVTAMLDRDLPPALYVMIVMSLCYVGAEQITAGWLATLARTAAHVPEATAALLVSGFWSCSVLGRLLGMRLLMRLTPQVMLRGDMIVAACGLLVIAVFGRNLAWLVPGIVLTGLGMGPVFPTLLAEGGRIAPGRMGSTSSWIIGAGSIGAMIFPWVGGLLIPPFGTIGAFALALAVMLVLWSLLPVLRRYERRSQSELSA